MRKPMVTRWTEEEIELLQQLLKSGATAVRAAAALDRSMTSVKNRARQLGTPFPHDRQLAKIRRRKYALAAAEARAR